MDFLEKVNLLMQERKLNRHTLSEACGHSLYNNRWMVQEGI